MAVVAIDFIEYRNFKNTVQKKKEDKKKGHKYLYRPYRNHRKHHQWMYCMTDRGAIVDTMSEYAWVPFGPGYSLKIQKGQEGFEGP